MGSIKDYIAVALLLAGIAGLCWKRSHPDLAAEIPGNSLPFLAGSVGPSANAEAPWVNESHWLVDGITRDLSQMIAFAAKGEGLDPASVQTTAAPEGTGGGRFTLAVKSPAGNASLVMNLQHHFWASENYTPLATALLKEANLKPAVASAAESTLPAMLTSPETTTLIGESKRISTALSKQPLDAVLHDEAALVIGTLAFREVAGRFTDIRPALGRMTAHLALARALNTSGSLCGRLAEALQLTLVERQAEALDLIEKLPPELGAWAMALRLRMTGDWRLLGQPGSATLLEQIAYAQAVASSRRPTALAEFLESARPKAIPDWVRIALAEHISVDEGHMFASPSIEQEFMELDMTRKAYAGDRATQDKVIGLLNEPEGNAVQKTGATVARIEVLNWGALGGFHQRHLMHAVDRTHYFFGEKWGVPQEDAELLAMARQRLGALKLYPLLMACGACDRAGLAEARDKAAEFCEKHPNLTTAAVWAELASPRLSPQLGRRPPPAQQWFGSTLLMGTAFDFKARDCELHCVFSASPDEMKKIAPYDFNVLYTAASRQGTNGYEGLIGAFKIIADYNLSAQRYIASQVQGDPKAYQQAMQKLAVLDPDAYVTLGRHLAGFGMVDEAAKAYESAFAKATDRVLVANNCEWLINYDMDHDRRDEALKIAAHAAEVYSFKGLDIAGRLMIRLQRWDEARKLFEAIAERYGDTGPLVRFLAEHQSNADTKAHYDHIIASVFKDGLKPVTLADFKNAPTAGSEITSASEHTQRYGLKGGDVIVALDGSRVDTLEQYFLLRSLKKEDQPLQIIYWDGSSYRELSASVPERRFGCGMQSYKK